VMRHNRTVRVCREYNAVRNVRCLTSEIWDRRWRLTGEETDGLEIRALGREGLASCPDWRSTGRPHPAVIASPSVWRGADLVAAPLAGLGNGWQAQLVGGEEEFFASLLSH